MDLTRRRFLELTGSAAAAALAHELFGLPELNAQNTGAGKPSEALSALAEVALARAKKLGATYADIRINRYRDQVVALRSTPDLATGKLNHVPAVRDTGSFGFGVRVIANGTWGFAASRIVTKDEIARVAAEAVAVAKANSALQKQPVRLSPVKAYVDKYTTPHQRNPFDVPIAEKLALLERANAEVKAVPKVFSANSTLVAHSEDKFFASSEGSRIQQYILQCYGQVTAAARDLERRVSRQRNYSPSPYTAGWEAIEEHDLPGNGRRIGEEVVEHLSAPPVTPGRKDLVLMPNHLALTIHESIGHSTELDRALGYEANLAGTSFLTPDKMGKFRIGSEIMNIQGDRTLPRGMSTVGYDDDGVKATEFDIVKNGVFQHFQTIRDQAHLVGEKESRGCCYADSFDSIPFQRIPNVWLKAGTKPMTLDDLIAAVDDGILIDGRGSWSIDQQRYNFQFGGDAFWEIKGGKKGNMISRVAYQSRSTDFWSSFEATADQRFWQNHGLTSDGKGQPTQINAMSHGSSPSLFRRINVLLTD
ncbi:MAG TPA: TldD/PmbA family protein [Terriglobales bacterium]|nr:TldD/PmbA family protein [Terriglobales bacterium]